MIFVSCFFPSYFLFITSGRAISLSFIFLLPCYLLFEFSLSPSNRVCKTWKSQFPFWFSKSEFLWSPESQLYSFINVFFFSCCCSLKTSVILLKFCPVGNPQLSPTSWRGGAGRQRGAQGLQWGSEESQFLLAKFFLLLPEILYL